MTALPFQLFGITKQIKTVAVLSNTISLKFMKCCTVNQTC